MENKKSKTRLSKADYASSIVLSIVESVYEMVFEFYDPETLEAMSTIIKQMLVVPLEEKIITDVNVFVERVSNDKISIKVFYKLPTKTSNYYLVESVYEK